MPQQLPPTGAVEKEALEVVKVALLPPLGPLPRPPLTQHRQTAELKVPGSPGERASMIDTRSQDDPPFPNELHTPPSPA